MKQTTLDGFCKVTVSSQWMSACNRKVLCSTKKRDIQEKIMIQSQMKRKRTSIRGPRKRTLSNEENRKKKTTPLLDQNERKLSITTNTDLITSDDDLSIVEVIKSKKYDLSETPQSLSRQNDENFETGLTTTMSQTTSQFDVPTTMSTPKKTSRESTSFSPKTPVSLNNRVSPKKKVYRKLFSNLIEINLLTQAIEQMNLAREGAIPTNNFNLEEIYRKNEFTFLYNKIDPSTTVKYDEANIIMPLENHSEHMFTMISSVFSNPINCGYFSESELDFVFSALTLSRPAQMLFVRMIKRKLTWHRVCLLKYPEISNDLTSAFNELVTKSFCNSDIQDESMLVMLNLLQADELTKVCRKLKVNSTGNKGTKIENMLKSYNNKKPLFPGMKSPIHALNSLVKSELGLCVRISAKAINIFDKIITLLIPNRDPEQTMSELFFMFTNIKIGEVVFPHVPAQHFPIFANTDQLERYAEAKAVYTNVLNSIKHKEWEDVRVCGRKCYSSYSDIMESELESMENSTLPTHIKRYKPLYIWLKALSTTIDAFKKTPETMLEAVHILKFLIAQNCFLQQYRAKWYSELALIEMHHQKDLETSAATTLAALREQSLTDVDLTDLLERAQKLIRRKTGISDDTKMMIRDTMNDVVARVPQYPAATVTIDGTAFKRHELGRKSIWLIESIDEEARFGNVEQLALQYYCDAGFSKGVHCESILPLTLFYTLLWEEIYNIDVPGAWVSQYQYLPSDLTTETFYESRKMHIDLRLTYLNALNSETLADKLQTVFNGAVKYSHISESNPFNNGAYFKEVINCLGVKSVIGICKKLVMNYRTWKAGFPDLIVWNSTTKKCKIVEVKGPGDKLSTKQKLWLQYLRELGVDAEVCVVRGDARYKPKFDHNVKEEIPDTLC